MITNKCRYGLVGLISIVLTFGLSASNRLRASFNATPAITYMSKYGIINHRTQWQAMLHATDHGRKITSLTQLNQILRAANLHSFAVANLRQVEHATRPTKTMSAGLTIINVPAFYSSQHQLQKQYWTQLQHLIKQTKPTTDLILNFAANTGGSSAPMIAGLAAIIPDGTLYTGITNHHRNRPRMMYHGRITGGLGQDDFNFSQPTAAHFRHIYAIIGNQTASAAEVTIMALKRNPHVTLVGRSSTGYTSLNGGVFLNTAVAVMTIGTLKATVKIHGQQYFNNQPLKPDIPTLYQPLAPLQLGQSPHLDADFLSELRTIMKYYH